MRAPIDGVSFTGASPNIEAVCVSTNISSASSVSTIVEIGASVFSTLFSMAEATSILGVISTEG